MAHLPRRRGPGSNQYQDKAARVVQLPTDPQVAQQAARAVTSSPSLDTDTDTGHDRYGFDQMGFHRDTGTLYDPEGYRRDGTNNLGYNRSGHDRDGYHRSTGQHWTRTSRKVPPAAVQVGQRVLIRPDGHDHPTVEATVTEGPYQWDDVEQDMPVAKVRIETVRVDTGEPVRVVLQDFQGIPVVEPVGGDR